MISIITSTSELTNSKIRDTKASHRYISGKQIEFLDVTTL